MSDRPNKLSQLWQELKRRKVLKAIAMYAGGAYVLIELANNVVEPLNLPDWTPRLVIIMALVGFPVMVVLSWVFDITPEGIGKTVSLEELSVQEQKPSPGKRSLKVSDVIILVLLVVVGILAYPRIFGIGSLNAMTFPVTVVNEFGEKETRRVFKNDYINRLALFPFNNELSDSSLNWLEYGIMDAIKEDQYQFSNIVVEYDDGSRHLSEQIACARNFNSPYFLCGEFNLINGLFKITTRLYQTSNGTITAEHVYRGANFFNLVDSICVQVRSDLEISEIILNSTPDLSISDLMTNNLEAYENYVKGRYPRHFDEKRYTYLTKAVDLDSTFAFACFMLASTCYNQQASYESAVSSISQAIRHRHRLSEYRDIEARIHKYLIQEDEERVIKLLELQYKLKPQDFNLFYTMLFTYGTLQQFDRMEEVAVRMNEVFPDHPPFQIMLADCYLLSGKADKSKDVLNELLTNHPEHLGALLKLGETHLHKKSLEGAEDVFNQVILLMPEEERYLMKFLDHISYMSEINELEEVLNTVEGVYREDCSEWEVESRILQNQLYMKPKTQWGLFMYPLSNKVFIAAFVTGDRFDLVEETFIFDSSGKVIRLKIEQWSGSSYYSGLFWKEDDLILDAKNLLDSGQEMDALPAFRKAHDQNPEHYYLANYIDHLEFVLSPDYELAESAFQAYAGQYGDLKFQIRDGRIFYRDERGLIFQLLPLSEDKFMVPSIYNIQIQMLKSNGVVTGLKVIKRNGDEALYSRTD